MALVDLRVLPTCLGSCVCFWLIFACVAIPMSLKSLDQGMYALHLSWGTQKIGDTVETAPGMKQVGLGNMLLEFPSTYQTMYFAYDVNPKCTPELEDLEQYARCSEGVRPAVKARSADGLEMTVSVSFQWRLRSSALKDLYVILGANLYRDEFIRFARAAIVEACSKFTADKFFTSRQEITTEMLERLSENFAQPAKGLMVDISDVQLRDVDLPDAFDEEILNTQEQMQEVEVAEAEREEQKIAMEREISVAEKKVDQVIKEAEGEAAKVLLENEAQVEQMKNFARRQALANAEILKNFVNDTDPFERLFEIMKVSAISGHTDGKLLVNL